jgi:hypothetical protein
MKQMDYLFHSLITSTYKICHLFSIYKYYINSYLPSSLYVLTVIPFTSLIRKLYKTGSLLAVMEFRKCVSFFKSGLDKLVVLTLPCNNC